MILLHGFPYDIHSFTDVAPLLADAGRRALVPYLRGHGGTVSLDDAGRSGQQAAIGADVVEFMDGLNLDHAVFAGFDWGGRAGCVAAAIWPERCTGLVSVNGYLIQNIAAAATPIAAPGGSARVRGCHPRTERPRLGSGFRLTARQFLATSTVNVTSWMPPLELESTTFVLPADRPFTPGL
ncbi:alpha/beta fold hydrolase [Glaciibacter flavus]|uniref:alpha/beta fold hydrolase n=1 Tax=Orlajensenia flava TaxID=2565934 RepID=UPI001F46C996|nr:alpha/beta fold hydrolase [Glaciibacter flavus]